MIVNTNDGIIVTLSKSSHHIFYTFLHLWVGSLYGIKLNTGTVLPCIYRTYSATTHTNTVVVTTQHHNRLSCLGLLFDSITLSSITNPPGKHNYLVVAITCSLVIFLMFEGK